MDPATVFSVFVLIWPTEVRERVMVIPMSARTCTATAAFIHTPVRPLPITTCRPLGWRQLRPGETKIR